jgi:hypothetical protein
MDAEEEDWLPSDFEVILGSLTILIRDQKDTEKIIEKNSKEIADRFRKEVLGMPAQPETCAKSFEESTELAVGVPENQPRSCERPSPTQQDGQPGQAGQPEQPSFDHPLPEEESQDDKEVNPLLKKLFKPIAVVCHPDKVKDSKLHKFFLIGRKAYDDQDFSMLLYILARIRAYDIELETSEIAEIRAHLSKKQDAIVQMKESLPYKWSFLREEDKTSILKNIRVMGAQHQNSNTV